MVLVKENRKILTQAIFGLLFIGLVLFFIRNERAEVHQIRLNLRNADPMLTSLGILTAFIYILLQGTLYSFCFRAVHQPVRLASAVRIFLKRNFVSVFLPAGGIASLAFFTKELEHEKISRNQIHFASSIYVFTSLFTVFLISIPILFTAALRHGISANQVMAFLVLFGLIFTLTLLFILIFRRGRFYGLIVRTFPRLEEILEEITDTSISKKAFAAAIIVSLLIETLGICQLTTAIAALGLKFTLEAAAVGYITAVLFMAISPFLKGLGAIELTTAFILTRFGFSTIESISITLLFRFFEFWLPLAISGASFMFVRNNIVLRVIPGVLAFILGIVNIISALTPAIPSRLHSVLEFLPHSAVNLSNYSVVALGLFLLVVSAFLFMGLRNAWFIAIIVSSISLVLHLTKAFDYEEALFALFVVMTLWITRKQYFVRSDPKLRQVGVTTALISVFAVLIYGITGFYFLEKKYFGMEFSLVQSIQYTLQNFFLFRPDELKTSHAFANDFIYSINIAGFLSVSFLFYSLVRPFVYRARVREEERERALGLVTRFGHSAMDYFKTSPDKTFFFSRAREGFLSFRTAGNYAIVLENPVCEDESSMQIVLKEFDQYCQANGLKPIFYKVPGATLPLYYSLGKRSMLFGQEAIIDLQSFSLEGGNRKSLRNSCNKARDSGFNLKVYEPPLKGGILQKIGAVSDEWLGYTGYREIVFSQGSFSEKELASQTVLAVEDAGEKVIAFLNVIPDYVPGECTFDLIRKIKDSPNGTIDFLIVEFFQHMKQQGYTTANLGFAPLSGIEKGKDIPERSMKFAYENIGSFAHYKGLREFKEKFFPEWQNRYIIYDYPYDLFYLPASLARVFKP